MICGLYLVSCTFSIAGVFIVKSRISVCELWEKSMDGGNRIEGFNWVAHFQSVAGPRFEEMKAKGDARLSKIYQKQGIKGIRLIADKLTDEFIGNEFGPPVFNKKETLEERASRDQLASGLMVMARQVRAQLPNGGCAFTSPSTEIAFPFTEFMRSNLVNVLFWIYEIRSWKAQFLQETPA